MGIAIAGQSESSCLSFYQSVGLIPVGLRTVGPEVFRRFEMYEFSQIFFFVVCIREGAKPLD